MQASVRVTDSRNQMQWGDQTQKGLHGRIFWTRWLSQIPVKVWWPWPNITASVLLPPFIRSQHISSILCYLLLTVFALAKTSPTTPYLNCYFCLYLSVTWHCHQMQRAGWNILQHNSTYIYILLSIGSSCKTEWTCIFGGKKMFLARKNTSTICVLLRKSRTKTLTPILPAFCGAGSTKHSESCLDRQPRFHSNMEGLVGAKLILLSQSSLCKAAWLGQGKGIWWLAWWLGHPWRSLAEKMLAVVAWIRVAMEIALNMKGQLLPFLFKMNNIYFHWFKKTWRK